MIASKQVVSVRMTDSGKIAVASRETREFRSFVRTLPSARWSRTLRAYLCLATPAAAWKVLNSSPECCHVEAEAAVRDLAADYEQQQRLDVCYDQPAVRQFDAWDHQCMAYNAAMRLPAIMLAMRMGTGKTKVAVDTCVNKGHQKVLILCPTSVRGVWRREFNKHAPGRFESIICEKGSVARRTDDARQRVQSCEINGVPSVTVINYESAWRAPFAGWVLNQRWDCVILDESHRIKGHSSKVAKFCEKLSRKASHRMCLTGTVMPHSPMDVFSQYRFLDPGIFGTSYTSFRNTYAVTGHFGADHIVEFKNLDTLARLMGVVTVEAGDDVLDLPDRVESQLTTTFCSSTRRIYESLEDEMIAVAEDLDDGVITASNALTKMLRLRQITSGIFKADDALEPEQISREKFDLIADLISDLPDDEPLVVFCEFREELQELRRLAEKHGRVYGEISGARKDLTENATMPEGITLMGVQTRSGGTGIDLTRARYCAYLSLPWSLGDYDQSMARIHRPGQERSTEFFFLCVEGTTDEVVARALHQRREVVDAVMDHLRESRVAK